MLKKKRKVFRQPKMKVDPNIVFSYKRANELKRFVNFQGNILSREVTGLASKKQRLLARAVKRARHLALLPFTQTL